MLLTNPCAMLFAATLSVASFGTELFSRFKLVAPGFWASTPTRQRLNELLLEWLEGALPRWSRFPDCVPNRIPDRTLTSMVQANSCSSLFFESRIDRAFLHVINQPL